MLPDVVVQKLDALPPQSGVYLFKDKKGAVVYVGKAKSLRARVRSYFQDASSDVRAFIPVLQATIGDLDTIVTANEKEATILENNLEDRRLLLVGGDDRVEVADGRLQDRDEGADVAAGILEVAPDARAQALGLADVDDRALLVLEEVDARLRRERVELLDDDVG